MQRRKFLQASVLAGTGAGIMPLIGVSATTGEPIKKNKQEFYELREYSFSNDAQQKLVEQYLESAAIPAWNRMGSKNIGVFRELEAKGQPKLFVMIPYTSLDAFHNRRENLLSDKIYQQSADTYLKATTAAPAYARIQSSLMKAFSSMPQIAIPAKQPRLLELRRYESHSEFASQQKIRMFGEGGEIEIFRRVGLDPVFFGETLIGERQPNITYMIAFDDMAEHDKNWKAFGADPEWVRIKDLPEYANTVSTITRTFLSPAEFSQI